jgi:glyoxylase-like metal-dependent hydrolase (beta-lactamase superfamily II)
LTQLLQPGNIGHPMEFGDVTLICGRKIMKRTLSILAAGLCANALATVSVLAQGAPKAAAEVTLTRLDCGTAGPRDIGMNPPLDAGLQFNDTYDYKSLKVQITYSCYLIKHGDDYLVWDSGQAMNAGRVAPKVSLVDLLGKLELKPENIKYIALSHYHGDHIGQVASFPKSTLLIGKGDWDALTDPAKKQAMADPANFTSWISGGSKVEPVPGDKDVFGDGTVVMLNTPGHTPGHHCLLVKLQQTGYVLLAGDLVHFRENYDGNGVPLFNTDRAATLGSLDRFKKIAANLKATVIIQHDERDIGKLPAFPAAAK